MRCPNCGGYHRSRLFIFGGGGLGWHKGWGFSFFPWMGGGWGFPWGGWHHHGGDWGDWD